MPGFSSPLNRVCNCHLTTDDIKHHLLLLNNRIEFGALYLRRTHLLLYIFIFMTQGVAPPRLQESQLSVDAEAIDSNGIWVVVQKCVDDFFSFVYLSHAMYYSSDFLSHNQCLLARAMACKD